jgi:tetratricopeptide (TPR) repeat protein
VAPASGGETAGSYYRRGLALVQDQHFPEALEQLNSAIKLDSTMSVAYNARGYAYLRLRQLAEALADFDAAITLNPSYANAYMNRSSARRLSGNIAGADADAAKWKELTPKPDK